MPDSPTPQARTVEQEIAAVVLVAHRVVALRFATTGVHIRRCACGDEADLTWHRDHVAAAIAPIIARERAAAAKEALTEAADAVARREDEALITALLAMECNEPARMVADWIEEMLRARADRIDGEG